jgi:hypothetical protein
MPHILNAVVNDAIHPHLHAIALRLARRHRIWADVEADDNGIRRMGEHHIGFADRTYAAMDHMHAHLFV